MTCSQFDWKAYFLGEIAEPERRKAEVHLKTCTACWEEVERLETTGVALQSLPQEEPPRRVCFVSDKVFEPRWWQRFWSSGPRLAFASAAMLAIAIVAHGYLRPAPAPAAGPVDTAALEARVQTEVARLVRYSIEKTAAESEARHARQTAELVAALERKFEQRRQADVLAIEENLNMMRKRWGVMYTASAELGGPR